MSAPIGHNIPFILYQQMRAIPWRNIQTKGYPSTEAKQRNNTTRPDYTNNPVIATLFHMAFTPEHQATRTLIKLIPFSLAASLFLAMRGQEYRYRFPRSHQEGLSSLEDRSPVGGALAQHTTPLQSTKRSQFPASTNRSSITKRALKIPQRRKHSVAPAIRGRIVSLRL